MDKESKNITNDAEFASAETEEKEISGAYTHKLRAAFTYEGKTHESLCFDWEHLTGNDSLAIEDEMQTMGKMLLSPAFSGEYLIRMAARACREPIGEDMLRALPLGEWNRIRGAARSFLLNSEL